MAKHEVNHHGSKMVVHNHMKKGGGLESPQEGDLEPDLKPMPYNAPGSHVEKEAEEKHKGGKVKRARGGHVEGHHGGKRMDRPGRKRGGSVGSDMHPLSSAAKVKNASGHNADTGDAADEQ